MPRALLSVYDKTGLLEFAQGLHDLGWTLIASGSTANMLRTHGLPVTDVADYTQSPEMLNGRVKTLHPAIHGGLLARATAADRAELTHLGWDYIDLVAVNLYPFTQTIAQPNVTWDDAIEQIDIGGVTLIRAAAKNCERVALVCEPADYAAVLTALTNNTMDAALRKRLAVKGFQQTSQYDAAIANFYTVDVPVTQLNLYPQQTLRYGENPHQTATLFSFAPGQGPLGGELLQGKTLSYNNLLDLDAAWRTVMNFTDTTISIVKHCSPCGIASAPTLAAAFQAALAADPVSAFGGIIASNKCFDEATARALGDLFVECIAAPAFSPAALAVLAQRTQCRLLAIPASALHSPKEWRSVHNGLLCQDLDQGDPETLTWHVVSERQPTAAEQQALEFAWKASQSVRSNAIVLARDTRTVGIGGGQPNRIDCVRIAATRAGTQCRGAVMASDAFFPFNDCVELAAELGVTAIVQPGGSKRDADSVAAANRHNLVMVMTGVRHFRH